MQTPARLSAIAIGAVVAALIAGWLWLFLRGDEQALVEARARAAAATINFQESFSDAIKSVDLVLELADRAIAGRDLSALRSDQEAARLLNDLTSRVPNLQSLWIMDQRGQVIFGDTAISQGRNLTESDFFRAYETGNQSLYIGASLKEQSGTVFVPVSRRMNRSGAFSGILLTAVNPAWFRRIAETLGLPEKASIGIVTQQGDIVASSGPQIETLDPATRRELASKAWEAGDFGSATLVVGKDGESENVLIGSRPVKSLNLVALYAVPYVTVLQTWSYQLWISSAMIAIALAVIVGGAIVMMVYGRRQGDLHRILGLRTAEAAQAAERLSLAVDTTGIGIFDYRMGSCDIAWAGIEANYFGLRAPPALTPRSLLRAVHPADRPNLVKRLRTMKDARDDTRFDTEFRLRHPEFGAIWVAARAKLFTRNGNGRGPGRLIGTLRDITERRRLQEHRETVLREINHRIKNSLQLMNSIMNLQSRRITSVDERARFEAARRRLISLATVYAHLDDTTQPDVVDLVPFLRRLCQDFSVAYMADGRVNLSFSASGATLVAATLAVPLGMAIGEILVNISLNGFAPQATGAVLVNVTVKGEQAEIAISHNGRGVEQAFEGDGATLGRLLIDAFVDQLGGTFRAEDQHPGLIFTLKFRVPPLAALRPAAQVPITRS